MKGSKAKKVASPPTSAVCSHGFEAAKCAKCQAREAAWGKYLLAKRTADAWKVKEIDAYWAWAVASGWVGEDWRLQKCDLPSPRPLLPPVSNRFAGGQR